MNSKEVEQLLKKEQDELTTLQQKAKKLNYKRNQLESEYKKIQSTIQKYHPKKIKKLIRATGAYVLGKRNRKQLYSKTYKTKQATNDLKGYKQALYNEGFIDLALTDLQIIYKETNNKYLKRAVAWELALWFANKQTESGAFQAISYIKKAKSGVRDKHALRTINIIEAESYVFIGENKIARELLKESLNQLAHPDLYLALSNTERDVEGKIKWINKMYAQYDLAKIIFNKKELNYDALKMKEKISDDLDGPKVSVILPAYQAAKGIQIAIESILDQSWRNLELLIVDDCSPDDTLALVRSYAEQDKRIKVFSTDKNSGPYVARNIALQAATGEFVTVNDADDWSHRDKLRIQVEHLINHPSVLGNTSEQARLTEDGQFYRRGNPGKYIFSNMSSFMFRRKQVMDTLGFWDTVRFAGDGEFIRRFIRQFGKEKLVHLASGPLSFPRQSISSLTSSSAFGYSGHFMGVRKEYVESFSLYHDQAKSLYYPQKQKKRLFPVPAPMLPTYQKGVRHFDLVIMLDIDDQTEESTHLLKQELQEANKLHLEIGIVHKTTYDITKKNVNKQSKHVRKLISQSNIEILVYGETVTCELLIIRSAKIMQNVEKFIPKLQPKACLILIDELPKMTYNRKETYNFRQSMHHVMMQFNKKGRWYPLNESIHNELTTTYAHAIRQIPLTPNNWLKEGELDKNQYTNRLKDWILI